MGYIHSRERILAAAMEVVHEVGLADLTYRLVGARLNIADRTVVYYFPTKNDLLVAVLEVVAEKLRDVMAAELGEGPLTADQALAGMWRGLATVEVDPFLRVYIQLVGLAAARHAPYEELISRIYHRWIDWLEQRMAGPKARRRAAAVAAFAQVDGLLLFRHMASPELAEKAAKFLESPSTARYSSGSASDRRARGPRRAV